MKLDDDYGVIKIELILSIIDNVANTIVNYITHIIQIFYVLNI